jgi:hypothetical protein
MNTETFLQTVFICIVVIVKIDGEDVEHRESGADQYFTKDFGKIYILR